MIEFSLSSTDETFGITLENKGRKFKGLRLKFNIL